MFLVLLVVVFQNYPVDGRKMNHVAMARAKLHDPFCCVGLSVPDVVLRMFRMIDVEYLDRYHVQVPWIL